MTEAIEAVHWKKWARYMQSGEGKKIVATKLFELANLAVAALVFGEVAGRESVRWEVLTVGAIAFVALYWVAGEILWRVPHHKT